MRYKTRFVGGAFDGESLNYKKKVGEYLRFNWAGQVWEYRRIADSKTEGTYALQD